MPYIYEKDWIEFWFYTMECKNPESILSILYLKFLQSKDRVDMNETAWEICFSLTYTAFASTRIRKHFESNAYQTRLGVILHEDLPSFL